jgi:hypothetical protein
MPDEINLTAGDKAIQIGKARGVTTNNVTQQIRQPAPRPGPDEIGSGPLYGVPSLPDHYNARPEVIRLFVKLPGWFKIDIPFGKHTPIWAAILLTALVSLACVRLTGGQSPATPTPTLFPVSKSLQIKPDTLPNAQLGVMYETEIQISQNVTPVGDITIQQGALPAGLQLEFLRGEDAAKISGIPDETGTYTVTLFAWCYGTMVSGQTVEKEYQIVVEK